eukprot:183688-Alexandrium_andersonii.AAC.1
MCIRVRLAIVRGDASAKAVQFPAFQGDPVVPPAVPRGALPVPPGPVALGGDGETPVPSEA